MHLASNEKKLEISYVEPLNSPFKTREEIFENLHSFSSCKGEKSRNLL